MTEQAGKPGYREVRRIAVDLGESLRGIALDAEGHLYAVGDSAVRVLDAGGKSLAQWASERPAYSVAVAADGRVWVGEYGQVEIFERDGSPVEVRADRGRLGLVTAIAFGSGEVFLADANARWIRRYDGEGDLLNNIGDRHRKGGFHIPNGVVDFAIDDEGVVHVANPGMHRVERYAPDGESLGFFGRFDGVDPAGFPGCCNPTNLALGPAGRVIVTEKAMPRVKVYAPDGTFLAVIAAEGFEPTSKNMDVAVDASGRVHVADTVAREIVVFEPVAGGSGR